MVCLLNLNKNYQLLLFFQHSLGEVENISGLVAFLASDDAAYITGETIVASGGMASRL